jgi:hypothetical protein
MNNLVIIILTFLTAGALFLRARGLWAHAQATNRQLASQAAVLAAHADRLKARRLVLERQLAQRQTELQNARRQQRRLPTPVQTLVPPDPSRNGGWPDHQPYFYLPKKDLDSVGYKLFENGRLTGDAATLFGMTAPEREAVDGAYDDLWHRFRQLEIDRMKPVEMPPQPDTNSPVWRYVSPFIWTHLRPGTVAYHIPALGQDVDALRTGFADSLQRILGSARADYLAGAVNDYVARNLDDLGQNARTIAFIPFSQPNGQTDLVYCVVNEGIDGTTTSLPRPLAPDSQAAYYAQLFGVDLPITGP